MRLVSAAMVLSTAIAPAAQAATILCAPVAVAEQIGEPGPLTVPASDKELGNPILFWIDTETGELQEHFDGGDQFITYRGKLDIRKTDGTTFVALHAEQQETYRIDLSVSVHPFQRSVGGALTAIGTCVPAAMGRLPEEDAAPIWPFPYRQK